MYFGCRTFIEICILKAEYLKAEKEDARWKATQTSAYYSGVRPNGGKILDEVRNERKIKAMRLKDNIDRKISQVVTWQIRFKSQTPPQQQGEDVEDLLFKARSYLQEVVEERDKLLELEKKLDEADAAAAKKKEQEAAKWQPIRDAKLGIMDTLSKIKVPQMETRMSDLTNLTQDYMSDVPTELPEDISQRVEVIMKNATISSDDVLDELEKRLANLLTILGNSESEVGGRVFADFVERNNADLVTLQRQWEENEQVIAQVQFS
jgi:hypothetical protein